MLISDCQTSYLDVDTCYDHLILTSHLSTSYLDGGSSAAWILLIALAVSEMRILSLVRRSALPSARHFGADALLFAREEHACGSEPAAWGTATN